MTPSHSEALAATKRVAAVNYQAGELADAQDALLMHVYQVSMELRRIPEGQRMAAALKLALQIVANTRESLD
jgi:hypothetical protein